MAISIRDFRMAIRIDNQDAKRKFDETRRQLDAVAASMKQLEAEGQKNSKEYKELKKQQDQLNTSLYRHRLEAGRAALTYNDLRRGANLLRRALNQTQPGTAQWKQYQAELQLTRQRMAELNAQAVTTQSSFDKLSTTWAKMSVAGAVTVGLFDRLMQSMRGSVEAYAEMEEAESQVIKYTGMTRDEVKQLNEQFMQMDTRTPRQELNRLAGEAGKLGITGVDEVRQFVEAANMINVALGEDLGQDAVNQIGKLSQMFGDSSRTLKENMLAVGSAVNAVAQSSSASEPYLVEFTARIGGVGKQAGLAVTDIMGFASALDQNMLRSEMASTALSGLIMRIYQEPAKYARLAGMEVQQFTTLMQQDANEAVLAFLESLGRMGGMTRVAPILKEMKLSGAEAASVISTLAANVAQVRREQENANQAFADGTSIVNEYTVQNNTAQASLEKSREALNQVRVQMGERLLPVYQALTQAQTGMLKALSAVISAVLEHWRAIATASAAIATYTIVINRAALGQKLLTTWTKLATAATNLLNKATKASPWGLVVTGLSAVVTYLALFRDKTDEATTAQQKLNTELERQKTLQDSIASIKTKGDNLQFLTDEQKQRLNADARQAISRLDDLISEGMITNKQWYESEKQSLLQAAGDNEVLRKSYLNGLEHDLQERMAVIAGYIEQKKQLEKVVADTTAKPGTNPTSGYTDLSDDAFKQQKQKLEQQYRDEQNLLKQNLLAESITREQYQARMEKAQTDHLLRLKALQEQFGKDSTETQGRIYDQMLEQANRLYESSQENGVGEQAGLILGNMDEDYMAEQRALKQQYLDGDIRTEQEYYDRLLELEQRYLEQRRELLQSAGMDTSEEDDRLLDMGLKGKQQSRRQDRQRGMEAYRDADSLAEKNRLLEELYAQDLITYEEYQDEKSRIAEQQEEQRTQIATAALQTVSQVAGSASQLMSALQDSEISKIEARYDKQIEAARKAGQDTTALEEEKEEAIAAVKRKYADKQFAANVLQIAATTAVAAMEAYKAMAGIPIVGPALGAAAAAAAVAAGAAQLAVAKQQRDEAKGLKEGGYSRDYVEGYTRRGNPDQVAGVIPVHRNEFVANHQAVANPHVRQFLDVFDLAQKNGTIRLLNTTQILEQVRTRTGRYDGGYTTTGTGATNAAATLPADATQRSQVVQLLVENNRLLGILCQKELVVDPRRVRDGIRQVERLEGNASR